jgi:hypothetical protein
MIGLSPDGLGLISHESPQAAGSLRSVDRSAAIHG